MKKWIHIVLIALMLTLGIIPLSHASNPISRDGYYHGIFLGGKVKVVNYGADIKVKVVNSFADLKVKPVTSFPDDIGEWQFVSYGEDFTIQYVNSFPSVRKQLPGYYHPVRLQLSGRKKINEPAAHGLCRKDSFEI